MSSAPANRFAGCEASLGFYPHCRRWLHSLFPGENILNLSCRPWNSDPGFEESAIRFHHVHIGYAVTVRHSAVCCLAIDQGHGESWFLNLCQLNVRFAPRSLQGFGGSLSGWSLLHLMPRIEASGCLLLFREIIFAWNICRIDCSDQMFLAQKTPDHQDWSHVENDLLDLNLNKNWYPYSISALCEHLKSSQLHHL